jgi:hypothetical protein
VIMELMVNTREDDNVDHSHYQHVFMIISENIPTFKSDLKKFKKYPEALESLCGQVQESFMLLHIAKQYSCCYIR